MQVTSFRVRGRRAHTQTYVTEPKTRRKGARCALMLRLDNKKARINRAFLLWWRSNNLKRIIKDTILNHQINVFAFFRGIPKNDDKSSIFQYLYMLLVSNRCRHLRFARHNTQAILESVLLL